MMGNAYTGYCDECVQDTNCCTQCYQCEFMGTPSKFMVKLSKRWELYENALDLWGQESQEGMFIEEIGEVLTAFNKRKRNLNGIDHREFVADLVDLEIMLEQMKTIHSDDVSWKIIKRRKLVKLLKYIQGSEIK